MSNPYLGEIRAFSFGFTPKGWLSCNGQSLAISQNQALFALLGTQYGGDGVTNFALPNLQGRAIISVSNSHPQGDSGGQELVGLTTAQIPVHNHPVHCLDAKGSQASPSGKFWAQDSNGNAVFNNAGGANLAAGAVGNAGSSTPHENMMPYLVVNYCICTAGIFPSRG